MVVVITTNCAAIRAPGDEMIALIVYATKLGFLA